MSREAQSTFDVVSVHRRQRTDIESITEPVIPQGVTRAGTLRIDGIDLLRGLVIIFMVLDHARDFLHSQAFVFDPADLTQTTPFLFATRWITHLCAPTFVFLAGVAIFLQRARDKNPASAARFLLTRGAWLIALEFSVISLGINFGLPFAFVQVIWAIGGSMVLMSALMHCRQRTVLVLGATIVFGHQLLAGIDATQLPPPFDAAWRLLMQPGPMIGARGLVLYPLVPWFGIMCVGYGLGHVFLQESPRRRRSILKLALGSIVTFVVLRALNGYGDPAPWSAQGSPTLTAMSFINVSKYPPSLLYVLVTLGVSLLLFLTIERVRGVARRVLLTFGRTPLFTYVVHFYLLHALAMLIGVTWGIPAAYFIDFVGNFERHVGAGFDLPVAYAAWIATLLLLYPLSAWFAEIKRRRRDWWLSYL